jgi:hypothetical protein
VVTTPGTRTPVPKAVPVVAVSGLGALVVSLPALVTAMPWPPEDEVLEDDAELEGVDELGAGDVVLIPGRVSAGAVVGAAVLLVVGRETARWSPREHAAGSERERDGRCDENGG